MGVRHDEGRVQSVVVSEQGKESVVPADYVFSTTDVQALARMFDPKVPEDVRSITDGLQYRNFLTVGLLLERPPIEASGEVVTDTWMYIHEPEVSMGRIQFFHNWNPLMVANPAHGWVGLEYFCNEDDALWNKSDQELILLGEEEFARIGLLRNNRVLDGVVIRESKTYPGYFGAYARFPDARRYFDRFSNLFLIGRNGMHRYNNQDHSMLTAMVAVDNIIAGRDDKENIWAINTEEEYHEQK
jgi:protoporphyrinogen oxidase